MALTIVALIAGILLLAIILQDAFEVMLLPRRVARRWRLMRGYFRLTWSVWKFSARATREGAARERLLSIFGPLSMMLLFTLWAAGMVLAFALIQWSLLRGAGHDSDFGRQAYLSGVTFFTLGYGDVLPIGGWGKTIAVLEAGSGFGLIAVVIGYLPVLYQLFSRREAHVIQLDSRAGSPPSAGTLIARHAQAGGLHKLDEMLRAWEIWGSDLLESHLSYPMLAYYRSQHDDQSWLAAIAAVMDTCAIVLVGIAEVHPLQARMTFAMARQVVVELVRALDLPSARPTTSERLDAADFVAMLARFKQAGAVWEGDEDAENTLRAIRATYEPQLHALASYLLIDLPNWNAGEDTPDHWERGARGIIARRLIDSLSGNLPQAKSTPKTKTSGTLGDRLRKSDKP